MKKFGDRKDARRLSKKEMTGMAYINCDLKKKRAYREVFMNMPMDVTEMIKYVVHTCYSVFNIRTCKQYQVLLDIFLPLCIG